MGIADGKTALVVGVANDKSRFQPVHAGHGAIHDNHFRMQFIREFDRLRAVARLADNGDIQLIFENAAESLAHQVVIVNQQD